MINILQNSFTEFSLIAADNKKLMSDLLDRLLEKNILENEYVSQNYLLEFSII